MNKQRKADLLLVMITAFWGASYFLTDLCLEAMPPLCLNAFRFLVAFAVLGAVYFRRLRHISRKTLLYSLLIALSLTMVYTCYVYGIMHTSISNAGFICALPVIFTPLLELAVLRKMPSRRFALALIICTVGLALMTLGDTFRPALGDVICLGTAFFYAVDLLLTDRAVRDPEVDPLQLGVVQLGMVGGIMLVLTLVLEKPHLPPTPVTWGAALFLAVFCTGIAFVVQAVQQQYTSASHVGLIFTLEPLFSAIVAYFFAHEVLGLRGYIGAALMMLSLILMEVDVGAIIKQKLTKKP
jgi:drug/metabolite transporter (DMT)-like permease